METRCICVGFWKERNSPRLDLPKKRPDFVDEAGGGGFWIWDAVGARDWRMEYVRCMVARVAAGDLYMCVRR